MVLKKTSKLSIDLLKLYVSQANIFLVIKIVRKVNPLYIIYFYQTSSVLFYYSVKVLCLEWRYLDARSFLAMVPDRHPGQGVFRIHPNQVPPQKPLKNTATSSNKKLKNRGGDPLKTQPLRTLIPTQFVI